MKERGDREADCGRNEFWLMLGVQFEIIEISS